MSNEGKTTIVRYRDLTQIEKYLVDNIERTCMRKEREDFINDERYRGYDPESIWYLRNDYINNWKHDDGFIFTKCECGSLEFDCLEDKQSGLDRRCVMKCKHCKKVHIEYN